MVNINGVGSLKDNKESTSNDETITKPLIEEAATDKLDEPYTDHRSITISLVINYSLYRKVNDKTLPKRRDVIGSCIKSSQELSSSKGEVEAYFPALIGIASNNPEFITRVKSWLNNISVPIDELGKQFDISFNYDRKRDYLAIKAKEYAINEKYFAINRQNTKELKEGLEKRINELNDLERTKYMYGRPKNLSDYLIYRHCLLYKDVAKDPSLINSDPSIRFYFKDDNREAERLTKLRTELNNAKRNYVTIMGDTELFEAVFIQYCVTSGISVNGGLAMDDIEKQNLLDKFSSQRPDKFNKYCTDKNIKTKALIEKLIARGQFVRAIHNQNISTFDGEFIGANIKEAVAWFNNPANAGKIDSYKNKLKHI